MITIPNKIVPYICHDNLKIFLIALFIEFEDNRLISLIDQTTIDKRVEIIRESKIFNSLIEALDLFGEEDVLKLLSNKIIKLTEDLSLGSDFKDSLEINFKDLV